MASAFWTLEDGRGFAQRWTGMNFILELIVEELLPIKGSDEFHNFLSWYIYKEYAGDTPNGYGGFIRGDESIMFDFDLRSFAPPNRIRFWKAAQRAMNNLKTRNDQGLEGTIYILQRLLTMHKKIQRLENPMLMNDMVDVKEDHGFKIGPGWP